MDPPLDPSSVPLPYAGPGCCTSQHQIKSCSRIQTNEIITHKPFNSHKHSSAVRPPRPSSSSWVHPGNEPNPATGTGLAGCSCLGCRKQVKLAAACTLLMTERVTGAALLSSLPAPLSPRWCARAHSQRQR